MSIHKDDLIGKFIEFMDKDGKFRIAKVNRIDGNNVTVKKFDGNREKVRHSKVLSWIHHGHVKEDIEWRLTK